MMKLVSYIVLVILLLFIINTLIETDVIEGIYSVFSDFTTSLKDDDTDDGYTEDTYISKSIYQGDEKVSEEIIFAEAGTEQKNSDEAGEKLPQQGTVEGDVKDVPPVDAGKQGKHVNGHNNNDEGKSQWKKGKNGVNETQEAWKKGKVLQDGSRVWDLDKEVGTKGETGVRVHIDKNGNIHGYPVDPKRYLK